ncbi:MAG: cell wall-binding repeat-containing protein [Oscillospiraceae bacterium]|nr:cell wall-binding repeat-containing protein [Oscillospiraceae bacterium]
MKRSVISLLLALCMVLSLLPVNVLAAEEVDVTRLAGDDRFRTAILAADQMKAELGVGRFDTILVASGTNFADALSGSYLAAVKQAPILLTCTGEFHAGLAETCNAMVAEYIRGNLNDGGTVYILGGEKAVETALEEVLQGYTVKRLAGSDRYATNIAILEEAGTGGQKVLVCDGDGFADSLSASATRLPILLVNSERGIFDVQKPFLEQCSGDLYIIGGTAAVDEQMEAQLSTYGKTTRVGGADRFETSVAIAETFFQSPDTVALAYGGNFPDGLCGGALASAMDAPLILAMDDYETAAAGYVQKNGIRSGVVLGGSGLIADQTVENIFGKQTPEETVPEETIPEETVPEETVPEETVPEETVPEETVPEETVPEETVPEETIPEETVPEETVPEETIPEETIPEETVPEETTPEEIPSGENVVDLTEKLDALMHQSAAELKSVRVKYGYYVAAVYYYEKVKDGGDWDIKLTDEWKFEEGKTYVYQGRVMRWDDPGNIHFGYVGAILFPEEFVCFGAGMNNITKFGLSAGSIESYYDDPRDQEMMRWGYQLYKSGY